MQQDAHSDKLRESYHPSLKFPLALQATRIIYTETLVSAMQGNGD